MSGSVNSVTLIGNLGRDPEIRSFQNGGRCANLSVATSETWKDRNTGERREKTEWSRVVLFDEKLVDLAEKYLRKGSKLYLRGSLETRKFTDNSGDERYTTEVVLRPFRSEIVMLDSNAESDGSARNQDGTPYHGSPSGGTDQEGSLDDEIVF